MKTLSNDIFFAQVESEIAAGRSVRFKVKGNSMYPFLRNGKDEVVLSPLQHDPKLLDIVLFKYKGKHVLHRIIDIDSGIYTIQGDGIFSSFEQCTRDDIIGKVNFICKNGGKTRGIESFVCRQFSIWWFYFRFCRRLLLALIRRVYK